jgi:ABC-type phosphate transport system substrate-binding protein
MSVRRIPALALTGAAAVALALPGVAAAKKPVLCNSTQKSIQGAGSTLQKTAQTAVWNVGFENPANKNVNSCKGTIKIDTWSNVGSGPGMENWGLNGHPFEPTVNYVGTDEPPNQHQKEELEKAGEGKPIQTVPVTQAAVALLVHLPEECVATSTPTPGRLVYTNKGLDELWVGKLKTWKEVDSANGNGDAVSGTGSKTTAECEEATITHYVREEESGTTHIFKKYLGLINKTATFETEDVKAARPNNAFGNKTWSEPGTGIAEETLNNEAWPKADDAQFAGDNGGGALVEKVLNNPSSVGYAALPDARAKSGKLASGEKDKFAPVSGGSGGPGTSTFWVELENTPSTFKDPSKDGDLKESAGESECTSVVYTNGTKAFPPKKTVDPWNEATTATDEPNSYTLCGMTYDLAYVPWPTGLEGKPVEEAVGAYYKFILNTEAEGGQEEIATNHDYDKLPSNVEAIAEKGIKKLAK